MLFDSKFVVVVIVFRGGCDVFVMLLLVGYWVVVSGYEVVMSDGMMCIFWLFVYCVWLFFVSVVDVSWVMILNGMVGIGVVLIVFSELFVWCV